MTWWMNAEIDERKRGRYKIKCSNCREAYGAFEASSVILYSWSFRAGSTI